MAAKKKKKPVKKQTVKVLKTSAPSMSAEIIGEIHHHEAIARLSFRAAERSSEGLAATFIAQAERSNQKIKELKGGN